MAASILAFLFLLPLQTAQDFDWVPPPAPSETAPATETPPATNPAPAPPQTEPPPAKATPFVDQDLRQPVDPSGLNGWLVGGLQWLTACGLGVLFYPCSCASCGLWGCLVQPAIVGYAETFVGDALGTTRAPALWPIVAAYGAGIVGGIVGLGLSYGYLAYATSRNRTPTTDPLVTFRDPLYWGVSAVTLSVSLVLSLVVPVTYALVAEPRKPGDDGIGAPGLLSPRQPQGSE